MKWKGLGAGAWGMAACALLLSTVAQAKIDNSQHIDVNSIDCVVTNHNSYAYDLSTGNAGLIWPKGSGKTAVFAAGLWVGAKIDLNGGQKTIIKVGEYSQQWGPGPMADGKGTADGPSNKVYKIQRGDTPTSNPDYANWPKELGAPTKADGTPQVLGDETLWSVFNDRSDKSSTNRAGTPGITDTSSLGIEVQQTTFAFSRSGPLNNVIFLKYRLINKGNNHLKQAYVSAWSDPDLGDATDDLVGCDTVLSLGYVYNATNNDGLYGVGPPCVGWDFFQGPKDKATGKRLPMTSFNKYINGTDPQSPIQTYNYMQGLNPDGSDVVDPNGVTTKFIHAGDPVKGTGWLDADPADRRLMLSAGPFDMDPGDTQDVVVGLIVGRGGDNKSSITVTKLLDRSAQFAFNANFDLGNPPPAPKVTVRSEKNAIDLSWDAAAVGDHQHKIFVDSSQTPPAILVKDYWFQGYNVWQARTPSAQDRQWKKVATYDIASDADGNADTVLIIYNESVDELTGATQRVAVQTGTNSGLKFHYRTDTDQINGGRIVNNKPYYFAVTAYNYEADNGVPYIDANFDVSNGLITESLENSPSGQALTIIPASTTASYDTAAAHVAGNAEVTVNVSFFRPDSANDHLFEVSFIDNADGSALLWRLTDLTTHTVVLDSQSDFTGVLHEDVAFKNFEVAVTLPYLISSATYSPPDNNPFHGESGTVFGGGLDLAEAFFGTSLKQPDLVPIELRFDPANGQKGYGYLRHGDPSYSYQGFGTVPFKAYDVSNPASPRQINVAFVQNKEDTTNNDPPRWLPSTSAENSGGREYLFVLKSSYSETEIPDYTTKNIRDDAGSVDMMYAFWLSRNVGADKLPLNPQKGDVIQVLLHKALTKSDRFQFHYLKPGSGQGTVVDNDLKRIRVVPNPYYVHSIYEVSQFSRIVKWTHLPNVKVTIRVFNLAGDLIRTLVKDDVSAAELTWNLLNESRLPVASGVYIYHVDAGALGTTFGRMAVFLEREKINFF